MQGRIKEIPKKNTFEPFTLEIDVKSEMDLYDLYHRLNIGTEDVKKCYTDSESHLVPFPDAMESDTYSPWCLIDRKVRDLRK